MGYCYIVSNVDLGGYSHDLLLFYITYCYPFMIYKYSCAFYLEGKKKKNTSKIITVNSIVLMICNRRISCVRLLDCEKT